MKNAEFDPTDVFPSHYRSPIPDSLVANAGCTESSRGVAQVSGIIGIVPGDTLYAFQNSIDRSIIMGSEPIIELEKSHD